MWGSVFKAIGTDRADDFNNCVVSQSPYGDFFIVSLLFGMWCQQLEVLIVAQVLLVARCGLNSNVVFKVGDRYQPRQSCLQVRIQNASPHHPKL